MTKKNPATAPKTPTPVTPTVITYNSLASAADAMKANAAVGPDRNGPNMNDVLLKSAALPPMKVNGQDNPAFITARNALRLAIGAVDPRELSRAVNLLAQKTISDVATPVEVNAMFGIYTAQGRRWQAHNVLAIRKAVAAIKTSRSALTALLAKTFTELTPEGTQVRNLARQVPNTIYVSYAYGMDALPAYLNVLKDNGLTEAAAELERHIGESNMRAVLAQQRAQERKKSDQGK